MARKLSPKKVAELVAEREMLQKQQDLLSSAHNTLNEATAIAMPHVEAVKIVFQLVSDRIGMDYVIKDRQNQLAAISEMQTHFINIYGGIQHRLNKLQHDIVINRVDEK